LVSIFRLARLKSASPNADGIMKELKIKPKIARAASAALTAII
jgi:hypothetical protein